MIETFKKLFTQAHEAINAEDAAKEALKVATLRVGSSGALTPDGMYATQCGRLAQARFLGFQSPPTEEMRVMFNGGTTLEDFITKRLNTLGLPYKQECEYNIEVAPGIRVSGRPDFEVEIGDEVVGVEVKSLASPFSVIKQRKNKAPFLKHLIQAATYMVMLQRERWIVVIGHSFHVNDRGMKAPPSLVWYELFAQDGLFYVKNENNDIYSLPFTKEHLIAYYQEVKAATEAKRLVVRPLEKELNVDTYNRCNYCAMKSACNEYDNSQISFEQWLEKVSVSKEPK